MTQPHILARAFDRAMIGPIPTIGSCMVGFMGDPDIVETDQRITGAPVGAIDRNSRIVVVMARRLDDRYRVVQRKD